MFPHPNATNATNAHKHYHFQIPFKYQRNHFEKWRGPPRNGGVSDEKGGFREVYEGIGKVVFIGFNWFLMTDVSPMFNQLFTQLLCN